MAKNFWASKIDGFRKNLYTKPKKYHTNARVYKKTINFALNKSEFVSNAQLWLYILYLFLLLL
mgnify:CR=1 FL=1